MSSEEQATGNIQQRVFEAVPLYPIPISIPGLCAALPVYPRESIRQAIARLVRSSVVEEVPETKFSYRRVNGAQRPDDGRGWPKGKPR